MRRQFAMLLLMMAGVGARAEQARWVEVRTAHFVVLTDSSEKQARRLAGQFERMRAVFHVLFSGGGDAADPPMQVLAVKDRKAMQALEPADYLKKNQLDLIGLFLQSPDRNVIVVRLDAQEEHAYSTVYHEYTHYMLRTAGVWLPIWLNEGLAQFYENTDINDKEVRLGQASPEMLQRLAAGQMLPLTTLLAVDTASPYYHDEEKGSMFYAEAWALTHYLIVTDRAKGTHCVRDYATYLQRGEDGVAAGRHAFGDLTKLQEALSMYVLQRNFTYFTMMAALPEKESVFATRPVTGPDADAVRAGVLVLAGRTKDAKTLLDAALAEDQKDAAAHEAMGLLRYREGDMGEAKRWYGEAVGLDPNLSLAQYYFARLSIQAGDQGEDEAIEGESKDGDPAESEFCPAYDVLAMFYASRRVKLDEAHGLNVRAIELEPENFFYRLNGSEILLEELQFDNALAVLGAAAPLAKTPSDKALIDERIKRVKEYSTP